jgi:hypothetical protein
MDTSPRNAQGSPNKKAIPEGPIHDFATVIENTQAEDWQRRTQAFATLVKAIPSGSHYSAKEAWYNSPPTLRHLALPLSDLLKDARSTVVKRTCESCSELFSRCRKDACYLLKDIMPTVLAVHAQTVQVIRSLVQAMVLEAFTIVPCKMAMPIWLDRLKSDKSRPVREACSLYLGACLSEWSVDAGYLTVEIWNQVGVALIKALKDASAAVRQNAKRGLETVHQNQSDIFDALLQDPDLARDMRVKKLLARIQAGENVGDDISVASSRVGSVASRASHRGSVTGNYRNSRSPPYYPSGRSSTATSRNTKSNHMGIPKTIGVSTSPSAEAPPRSSTTTATTTRSKGGGLGPPVRMTTAPFKSAVDSPPPIYRQLGSASPASTNGAAHHPTTIPGIEKNHSFDTVDSHSDLPVIATASELREVAKNNRNSRRSSLLQERFKSSSNVSSSNSDIELQDSHDSLLDDILEDEDIKDKPKNSSVIPGHMKIAQELLEAHKRHVDMIMETLKVEMDALKDFELVLLEEGPRRPTEDEVLEYFESVGLCLEQRTKAGSILQKKMDRISQG